MWREKIVEGENKEKYQDRWKRKDEEMKRDDKEGKSDEEKKRKQRIDWLSFMAYQSLWVM